jgi:PhnB protein
MFSHYLMFAGDCAQALDVYARAFGADIVEKQTYGDIPNPGFPVSDEMKGLVLHSRLVWEGSELMCADASERHQYGDTMYVSVSTTDEALVRRAWDILKDGAEVYMDLAATFFSGAHGSLRDRFGINWMFTVTQ